MPSPPRHAAQSQARPRRRRSRAETRILPRYRPLLSLRGYGACTVNREHNSGNSSHSFSRLYVIWLPRQQSDALATVRFDCRLSARAGSSSGAGSSAAPLSGVGSTGALGGGRAGSAMGTGTRRDPAGPHCRKYSELTEEPCPRSRRVLTWRLTLLPLQLLPIGDSPSRQCCLWRRGVPP